MAKINNNELKEMKKLYLDESSENMNVLEREFQKLESNFSDNDAIVEIFRIFHSFKGMAGTIGYRNLEKFFHSYESLISSIQEKKVAVNQDLIEFMFKTLDVIEQTQVLIKNDTPINDLLDPYILDIEKFKTISSENSENIEKSLKVRKLFEQYGFEDYSDIKIDFKDTSKKFYFITITLDSNIKLKVARVFVILKNISTIGSMCKSFPDLVDLIDGKFKDEFSLIFHSKQSKKEIEKTIIDAHEVNKVSIEDRSIAEVKKLIGKSKSEEKSILPTNNTNNTSELITNLDSVKVSLSDLDHLMEYFGELLIRSKQLERFLDDVNRPEINEIVFQMQNYMFNLQDIVLQIQMVPISIVFRIFPRMIRKIAQQQNKSAQLIINHHDVKVDRKILNDLSDVLNHLLRNAVSHGIEKEFVRIQNGKEPQGRIVIETNVQNNVLNIEIEDDGRGVDLAAIKRVAKEKGLYTDNQLNKLLDEDLMELIFEPNFSTSSQLDEISGRGLGLNIVKQRIETLGGSISVYSNINQGTSFKVMLPISRTLIRALLIRSGSNTYSIPLEDIQQLMEISNSEIQTINDQEYIFISDINQSVRLFHLDRIFNLKTEETGNSLKKIKIIHIKKGSRNFALSVDEFIKESEIVIKSIDSIAKDMKGISGAAILDDGTVSLIIDSFSITN